MNNRSIPPRWKNCPRRGELVQGKFLPFKTPLDSSYSSQLEPQHLFTPEMLLATQKNNNFKIGLWIDLTNTSRYYQNEVIEKQGISYTKIAIRGHGQAPTEEETKLFVKMCNNYIKKNPSNVIAIHCTHGFNRTGFLICAFLCEEYDWAPDAALSAFTASRPPGIYKGDYIKELFRRYGDIDDAPPAPDKPGWCFENENIDDDGKDLQPCENNTLKATKKTEFMEGIPGVEFVSDYYKSQNLQRKVQGMCKYNSRGFPGSQPVSMGYLNIGLLRQKPYQVSWKADGTRYMMLIEGKGEVYFIDRDNAIYQIVEGCPTFPRRKHLNEHIFETLLDGEMIIDVVDGINHPKFLIYDIIKFENIDVGLTDFKRRTLCINKEIIEARETGKAKGIIDRSSESFSIRIKEFWDLQYTKSLFGEKFNKLLKHEVDGLIFQPVPDPYVTGQCPSILKWKPHTLNSIDFKVRIEKIQRAGCLPETLASLYVGKQNIKMAQIKATKEFRDGDNKIVECTWDYEKQTWKFMRIRTDKSFPNSHETALSVWETIRNPLTKEKLLSYIEQIVHSNKFT